MTARAKLVVAGLIVDAPRLLITQRLATQTLPLQWEFPGGKMESGERPEKALARELWEELGVHVAVGRVWDVLFHVYPDFDLVMLVYPCKIKGEQAPRCAQVASLAWVQPEELGTYAILEADRPLVDRLLREGLESAYRCFDDGPGMP